MNLQQHLEALLAKVNEAVLPITVHVLRSPTRIAFMAADRERVELFVVGGTLFAAGPIGIAQMEASGNMERNAELARMARAMGALNPVPVDGDAPLDVSDDSPEARLPPIRSQGGDYAPVDPHQPPPPYIAGAPTRALILGEQGLELHDWPVPFAPGGYEVEMARNPGASITGDEPLFVPRVTRVDDPPPADGKPPAQRISVEGMDINLFGQDKR